MMNLLFVCIENSCRSQMAEGWARSSGGNRVRAFSAGSRPSGNVNEPAVAVMKEINIDLSGHTSSGFEALPDFTWDSVITMGCGQECPFVPARNRIDWDIADPKGKPISVFRTVRDEIRRSLEQLLDELEPEPDEERGVERDPV